MLKRSLTTCLLLLPLVAWTGTYKWVDKDGNVHYSDQPVEGAEPVKLPEPTTFDAPEVRPGSMPRTDEREQPAKADTVAGYTDFGFISPKQDQVFWATGGEVPVQLSLRPGLREGHVINLYFNGELTASPMTGLGTTLQEAWRGAHTVRAVIVDAAGKEVASAGPVTFHVKQRSIANPPGRNPASGR